jgi:hypothetical protein
MSFEDRFSARLFQGQVDVLRGSATVDPASVASGAAGQGTTTVSVPGAKVGDFVMAFPGVDTSSIDFSAVAVTDNIKITIQNLSGGAVDLASSTWRFMLFRPKGALAAI